MEEPRNNTDREAYQSRMEQIHAPEALIQRTLDRVHAEEQNPTGQADRKIRKYIGTAATGVMVAAAALAVIVMRQPAENGSSVIYNQVTESELRTELKDQQQETMDLDQYSQYLGVDLNQLIDEDLVKNRIEVTYQKDQEAIQTEEAILYYNIAGNTLMVKLSKTIEVAPEALTQAESVEIEGGKVYFGESTGSDTLCAAGKKDGIAYYLQSDKTDKEEFEAITTKIVKNL